METGASAMSALEFAAVVKHWAWYKLFDMFDMIGSELRGRKERFLKGDLLESVVAKLSGGALEHVDKKGYDLQGASGPLDKKKVECKTIKSIHTVRNEDYCEACERWIRRSVLHRHLRSKCHKKRAADGRDGCVRSRSKRSRKSHTGDIRLVNTIGTKGASSSLAADFYLLYSDDGTVAVISRSDIVQYIKVRSDCVTANIPTEALSYIRTPDERPKPIQTHSSIEEELRRVKEQIIDEVWVCRTRPHRAPDTRILEPVYYEEGYSSEEDS